MCRASSEPASSSVVSSNTDGSFAYQINAHGGYSGCNAVPVSAGFMSDFYLPYFDDMGIKDIKVADPFGISTWNYAIEASHDVFDLGGGSLHFYTAYRPKETSYNVINIDFNAAYGEVKGPFYETLQDPTTGISHGYLGDPGLPGSPKLIAALDAAGGDVPEPATIPLLALGALSLFALRRKAG